MELGGQEGIMAASAKLITERMVRRMMNTTLNNTTMKEDQTASLPSQTASSRTESSGNSTLNLISNLVFAENKSVRTSTIILATFNILAALATACSILYDCYWASRRCNPKFKASKFCVSSIHPAETFPLVLAIGIVIQGLVFAGVQAQGLTSLFQTGCASIAQFMWPAMFIVPYIQLVFGTECAIRSYRSTPFQARGKWDVTICCGVVVLLLILTWIPSYVRPVPNACFASLIWFVSKLGRLGFAMLTTVGVLMIAAALTIFIQLSTVNLIDQHQRIAASRMVYYLVLGIISLSLVVPFFFSLIDRQGDIKLAMMATVVLNLSGLMSGLLQLFLRFNTATTSFAPKQVIKKWAEPKHNIRMFGPNEVAMHAHLVNPVTIGPRSLRDNELGRSNSQASEKGRVISMDSLRSPPFGGAKSEEADMSNVSKYPAVQTLVHIRKPSYPLYPVEDSNPIKPKDSIYNISELMPPPAIRYPDGPKNRRDFLSVASSATVQIGLRISHAPPSPQENFDTASLPSTTYKETTLKPPAPKSTSPPFKLNRPAPPSASMVSLPSETLIVKTSFQTSTDKPFSPPLKTSNISSPQQSPKPSINKTLPPTPNAFLPKIQKMRESTTQLSPTVYSLSPTVYSPGGRTSPKTNNHPIRDNSPGSPMSRAARQTPSQETRTKAHWI